MATDPPESDHGLADESDVPQIGGTDLERLHSYYSAEDLKEEIEARDSKLAILSDAAKKREDELRRELARQSTHFAERISRLQRELQDQSMQSAECIRELKAEIEHLKITRFEAKRENHSIKTSLSWRLTWPLRVLRDAGMASLSKSQQQFRLSLQATAFIRKRCRSSGDNRLLMLVMTSNSRKLIEQSIERFTEGLSSLDRNKETVLLVTHEISRTGASIIALNLARASPAEIQRHRSRSARRGS